MPDKRRTRCIICERPSSEVGPISWRGKCLPCATRRQTTAIAEMAAHHGPTFDLWRARVAASVGATVLDANAPRA